MRKYMKKIAAITLGVATFFALTAGYAYAATNDPYDHEAFSITGGQGAYYSVGTCLKKVDSSDMFIQFDVDSVASSYRVRAMACNSNSTTTGNYTLCDSIYVNYVGCKSGRMYGIENGVSSSNPGYGLLQFYQNVGYGTTMGYWSANTTADTEYNTPTAPW